MYSLGTGDESDRQRLSRGSSFDKFDIDALVTQKFVEGLADDTEAIVNGCTESWSNGMVEGFVNKVKWLKRSGYGRAGFPLLQRRVLLHPTSKETRCLKKICSA